MSRVLGPRCCVVAARLRLAQRPSHCLVRLPLQPSSWMAHDWRACLIVAGQLETGSSVARRHGEKKKAEPVTGLHYVRFFFL